MQRFSPFLLLLAASVSSEATAEVFDIADATGPFTPSFRDAADTVYLGWDLFGSPGDAVINDTTPDVGTAAGSFVTTNGEDHQSGSLNYYSGGGSVAEDVTFAPPGAGPDGYTTVIVQAVTLFGGWGADIDFGPIDGVDPTLVLQSMNAAGAGQIFVKYEVPGVLTTPKFSISSGPDSTTSFGLFIVDAAWSANGYAADTAIATPEPAATLLAAVAAGVGLLRRR